MTQGQGHTASKCRRQEPSWDQQGSEPQFFLSGCGPTSSGFHGICSRGCKPSDTQRFQGSRQTHKGPQIAERVLRMGTPGEPQEAPG